MSNLTGTLRNKSGDTLYPTVLHRSTVSGTTNSGGNITLHDSTTLDMIVVMSYPTNLNGYCCTYMQNNNWYITLYTYNGTLKTNYAVTIEYWWIKL